jgi:hypothetical protein
LHERKQLDQSLWIQEGREIEESDKHLIDAASPILKSFE